MVGESWIWFLSRLKECIGDMPFLVIMLDRANSIEMTIQDVFPKTYHGLCCHHLLRRALNEDYHTRLDKIVFEKWSMSCFHVVWYNIMTSNNVVSINSLSRDQLCNNNRVNDVMLELKAKKKVLLSTLRRLSIRGSTNPRVSVYTRLIKAYEVTNQMKNEMKIIRYTLFSCYGGIQGIEISTLQYIGVIVFHNGNISIDVYRVCVSCASFS
uniref:MULE transposase domain-containing protein n=1 Tax=Lactuca sativa TaxID=4236 RepID=A0A9R1UQU6_LACSA|nr:hypothetical protein LSAT_V11C800421720 [Lactuca sativa]